MQRKEQIRQKIRQAAFEIHTQGRRVYSRTVAEFLNEPGILRSEAGSIALREVRYELYQEQKIDNFHEPNS
jgi:hypothetical protein